MVDDQSLGQLLVRLILEGAGHAVLVANTGEEAIEIARSQVPDLILMDMSLPGISGLEATRFLKEEPATQGICIVGLSAYAMAEEIERALVAGCDGYVTKPIDTRRLAPYVESLLASFRQGREGEAAGVRLLLDERADENPGH